MEKHILSKSTFIRGAQCLKSLYLNKKRPFLRDRLSAEQRAKFSRGHEVGLLAQELFPGGTDLKPKSPSQYRKAVYETAELINESEDQIIYEATFQAEGVLIMLDILQIKNGKLFAYEVKSSRSISDTYIMDAALQYYVMQKAGFQPENFNIIYINVDYVMQDRLELEKLFLSESVMTKIIPLQDYIEQQIHAEKETLKLQHSPKIDIGRHCFSPYPCDFIGHCWKHLPETSVFDLAFVPFEERMDFYNKQLISPEEIKEDQFKNEIDLRRINAVKQNALFIDCNAISELLQKAGKAPAFLHILTRKPAIPEYPGTRPYQAIPFGIGSISILNGKEISHTAVFDKDVDPFSQMLSYIRSMQSQASSMLVFDHVFLGELIQEAQMRSAKEPQEKQAFIIDLSTAFESFAVFQAGLDARPGLFSIAAKIFKDKAVGKIRSNIEAVAAYQKASTKVDFENITLFQTENLRILKNLFDFLVKKCNIV